MKLNHDCGKGMCIDNSERFFKYALSGPEIHILFDPGK